jgi:hypothetical protein
MGRFATFNLTGGPVLPIQDGAPNQIVVTNGQGTLQFAPVSLPTEDSVSGRSLVTNGAGVLSFSAMSLPAADGAANKTVTTNGSGKLQFALHSMPTTDGSANAPIITDGSGHLKAAAFTLPATVPTVGKLLQSDGTNVASSAYALPVTLPTAGLLLQSNGTSMAASAYTIPTTVPAVGKILQSDGTNLTASAYALPTTLPAAGKLLASDGTSVVATAYTMPAAAGASGNVIQSDGTNLVSVSTSAIASTVAASLPTVSYWNAGSSYAPVLPSAQAIMAGKSGVTSLIVGGDVRLCTTADGYCSATGACCLWTVPAGVTEAEFQIWGGGGNSTGCSIPACCAMGAPGGSGEYTYVRMGVTAGQTYTLCAGGAAAVGSCYSYCNLDGCNSFVCGSNSTCIMSCGGSNGACGARGLWLSLYPSSVSGPLTGSQSSTMYIGSCELAFGGGYKQTYRFDGKCAVGLISTLNTVKTVAKVPSTSSGTLGTCGSGDYSYHCYKGLTVQLDHTLDGPNICYISQCYSFGCQYAICAPSYVTGKVRSPGMGGVPPSWSCGDGSNYGDRGSAGLIRVSYK